MHALLPIGSSVMSTLLRAAIMLALQYAPSPTTSPSEVYITLMARSSGQLA